MRLESAHSTNNVGGMQEPVWVGLADHVQSSALNCSGFVEQPSNSCVDFADGGGARMLRDKSLVDSKYALVGAFVCRLLLNECPRLKTPLRVSKHG